MYQIITIIQTKETICRYITDFMMPSVDSLLFECLPKKTVFIH